MDWIASIGMCEGVTASRKAVYVADTISLPTIAGGLEVLRHDFGRAAADKDIPLIDFNILPKEGYVDQRIRDGRQLDIYSEFDFSPYMRKLPRILSVRMDGRDVYFAQWLNEIEGINGHVVPQIFFDTDVGGNSPDDRKLTARLYGGNKEYRLRQEIFLGFATIKFQDAYGIRPKVSHLNEGHGSFAPVARLAQGATLQEVRDEFVFTTHTILDAGHDRFDYNLVKRMLKGVLSPGLEQLLEEHLGGKGELNMTKLALNTSRAMNGVSKLHGKVSREAFPYHDIQGITNGVHPATWTSPPFQELYDRYLPGWREDPQEFLHADRIPDSEIIAARAQAKSRLIETVKDITGIALDPNLLTIGFARRAVAYKRPDLIFDDLDKLVEIGAGKLQLVFAGKADPNDEYSKGLIAKICGYGGKLAGKITVVYLENYRMELGAILTSGADGWLNNPIPGMEADGTSHKKRGYNGGVLISTRDGGTIDTPFDDTYWIGDDYSKIHNWEITRAKEHESLINILGTQVIPDFYAMNERIMRKIKNGIKNCWFNSSHRMLDDYMKDLYQLDLDELSHLPSFESLQELSIN